MGWGAAGSTLSLAVTQEPMIMQRGRLHPTSCSEWATEVIMAVNLAFNLDCTNLTEANAHLHPDRSLLPQLPNSNTEAKCL